MSQMEPNPSQYLSDSVIRLARKICRVLNSTSECRIDQPKAVPFPFLGRFHIRKVQFKKRLEFIRDQVLRYCVDVRKSLFGALER